MQKKKLISIAIALTLQSYYIPAIAAENNDDEKECPSNISSLPKEKRAKLSPTCLATLPENDNHWGWVAGGVAALVAGVAIGVENNGGGDSTHSYTPPTPDNGGNVTPPDDGGNVTPPDDSGDDDVTPPDDSGDDDVTPPDDSGDDDVTPPDDSGDDDVTPPDDSGDDDVTPPDDSGDDDVTPPDDSGDDDVTPPDDSGDDDVTPPDDSGDDDVTPPDDSGDDDVTPPDDSGDDDDTPTDNSVTTFSNGVTIDKGKDTLAFDSFKLDNGSVLEGAVWNYSEQDDQWQLTTEDGKTLNVTGWDVTDANAAVIEGTQENGLYWKYDSRGYLIIADDNTTVITGDGESHTSDRGMDISGQDRTGVIISGDRTVNTLTGDSSVTDGATGMVITGDSTTNAISGHSTVDNATGALISGNNTTTDFSGDITVSGGGTAIVIDGDNATVQNTGTSSISGAGSTGTTIDGNNARVSNDGDMTITEGATGGHIIGDNAVIDNVGDTTVSGAGSAALYVDGDNTLIINEGDQTISGGATGTRIDGSKARIANTGDIAVDGAGSAAVVINGDNGSLTQAGDLLVTDGAMGIITYGTGNEAKNTGNATVRDQDSVGFVVAGEQNAFRNKGNINVSLNGTGALVSGNTSQVTLDGDINVISVQDSDGVFRGATGVNVSGDSNTVNIAGNVNMSAEHEQDSLIARQPSLIGITVSGANNDIALNGALDINVGDLSTVSGGKVTVRNYGDVTNESTGSISSVGIDKGGVYTNEGTTAAVSVDGGVFNNTGTVTGKTGTTVAGSIINNSGSMNAVEQWASTMNNTGTVSAWVGASGSTVLNNYSGGEIDKLNFTGAATVNNAGIINNGSVDKGGTFNNLEGGVVTLINDGLWAGAFNNWGTVNSDADIATGGSGHTLYNGSTGVINGQITTAKNNGGSKAINDGTINIDKTGNVAMSAHGSAKMVNNGEINLGTKGTTQTGMVGMQLESDAKSDAVIENNSTINIYASNSYAFSQLGSNGHIVNNGTVYIDDSVTGSGFIKQSGKTIEGSGENGDGTEVHYVDFIAPTEPTINDGMATVTTGDSAGSSTTNNLSGYVVGTSADGSAGKLKVSNASMNGVEINTGFAAGTADTTVSFDNVVEGSNLSDAGAIQSTTVVWNAQGSTDSDGNVDVTMTKNAYADVATDASVSGVASALDAGYTNNELYTSLNVGTTAELNNALKQVSGAQATTVFREARILSNRFNMLADAAPQMGNGLAFNVVAKGDPRAELGNDTQYDMLALRRTLDLTTSQNLTLEYGIARLDGDGSKTAGDNGLTGGYSQFFGLKHSMAFDEGLAWNNSLRYDVHNLDSSRFVSYGDTNKVADSDVRQQYFEFRSEGAKTFTLMDDTLKVTPYAGVKFRHTLEDGYKEHSAGDFNLSMNSGNETAVDSIVGLKLDYAGKDGWSATATLEGGPNLSYNKSQRTASLQGAAGQSFGMDDGQKGGGVNGLATIGVKYSSNDTALHLDAYQWKEDGISDKGFMLNVKKTFR
ncbi:autotransporter adhesin BigA [Salmonella enterica]|nr:autotransporter domain-containing protein [Salmonella enterica]ECH8742982.1 autotransporter domain-containing protein [Salmonella enterica subsp. enterica serovar Javiana]EAZ2568990.1 autotransporter domain-containing protein [Salmonella enterica]EBA1649220.1 autotransporter domain-containing protein [Salmonella enterica]EBH0510592.1 autotransporter domain-containing protein [Salmonella enterica]